MRQGQIIAREAELGLIEEWLAGVETPSALLIEGEAGIGKTTLWRGAVESAAERGYRVLACRPAGSEVRLAYAALGDLVHDVLDDVLPELPTPRRRALQVALLLEDADGSPPDERAVGLAVLGALQVLARGDPVLLALDDAHWLDESSVSVLSFALRRLGSEPVRALVAQRREGSYETPLGLDRTFGESLRRLELGPLSVEALHGLLSARLGSALPRPTLLRVHEASAGNAFFALEIARALDRHCQPAERSTPLPIPKTLDALVQERLTELPHASVRVLEYASVLADPALAQLERAAGSGVHEALEHAVAADVVTIDGERVSFVHPLLSAALYSRMSDRDRHDVHRRLADVVEDAEERAWHAALGAEGPDEPVAALVEDAARRAEARGAPGRAAELAEHASSLSPEADPESGWRRSLLAGEYHLKSGDIERARVVLAPLSDIVPVGPLRVRVLSALADCYEEAFETATDFLARAVEEAGDDPALLTEIVWKQAILAWAIGSFATAAERFTSAVQLAEEAGEERLLVLAFSGSVFADFYLGRHDRERLAHALAIDEALGGCRIAWGPELMNGFVLLCEGHLGEARSQLERLLRRADEEGDEYSRVMLLQLLSHVEWCAGKLERSAALAEEALAGADPTQYASLHRKARADATLGNLAAAHLDAENALELAEQAKDAIHAAHAGGVLGFLGLTSGDLEAAHRHLDGLPERLVAMGLGEPAIFPFFPDAIETLIGLGELERAEAQLGWLEERGRTLGRTWAVATGARCRGLLISARGDHASALAAFDEALAHHEHLAFPFERGRTLLALGQTRRRAKQKRAARDALTEALSIFEQVGAPLWAEKARADLARIGGRTPTSGSLTPTEERVAELVAEGRSNKEVAASLFVTVKTVERNLSRVYEKLGIRSRAELARSYAREERTNQPPE